jgi:hypothetical protein
MKFTGHIALEDWKGQPLLVVQDYELLDFLEDHFESLGVETAQVCAAESVACFQLLFPSGTSQATVWRALEAIGRDEIERIVAINSGAGSVGPGA